MLTAFIVKLDILFLSLLNDNVNLCQSIIIIIITNIIICSPIAICWTVSIRFDAGQGFSLGHNVKPVLGPTQPPNQWVPEATGVKQTWHEADHSPLPSAKIKMVDPYFYFPIYLHCVVFN
jgi:hypothetical protein